MSHYEHLKSLASLLAFATLGLLTILAPVTAHGSSTHETDLKPLTSHTRSMSLEQLTGQSEALLEAHTPKQEIRFSFPQGETPTSLSLHLAMISQGGVDKDKAVSVQLNNDEIVPVYSQGHPFEAKINLSSSHMRVNDNVLHISYEPNHTQMCSQNNEGKWAIDMSRSQLVSELRSDPYTVEVKDFESYLSHPMTAPNSVAIITATPDKMAYEALSAQAIGVRMNTLPRFKIGNVKADLKVYIGTYNEISKANKNQSLNTITAHGTPPRIIYQKRQGQSELFIMGPTQGETLEILRAFATKPLPRSSRHIATLEELEMQVPFDPAAQKNIMGRNSLRKLGPTRFSKGLSPQPVSIKFEVDNALTTQGELLLGLSRSVHIQDSSRLSVDLNGKYMGHANLDKARKKVAFPLPAGSLKSGANTLTLLPVLSASNPHCLTASKATNIKLSPTSKLTLETLEQPRYDLSTLTTNGAPFSNHAGQNTDIYLTGSPKDRAASLSLLAKLAQQSGRGWVNANYVHSAPNELNPNHNSLILGPLRSDSLRQLENAPRPLLEAMKGRGLYPENLKAGRLATLASLDGLNGINLASQIATTRSKSQNYKVNGLAALYANDIGATIGVISSPQSHRYNSMAKSLINEPQWHMLTGSVARWSTDSVHMLQLADERLTYEPVSDQKLDESITDITEAVSDFNAALKDKAKHSFESLQAMFEKAKRTQLTSAPSATPSSTLKAEQPDDTEKMSSLGYFTGLSQAPQSLNSQDEGTDDRPEAFISKEMTKPWSETIISWVKSTYTTASEAVSALISDIEFPEINLPDFKAIFSKLQSPKDHDAPTPSEITPPMLRGKNTEIINISSERYDYLNSQTDENGTSSVPLSQPISQPKSTTVPKLTLPKIDGSVMNNWTRDTLKLKESSLSTRGLLLLMVSMMCFMLLGFAKPESK